MDIEDQRQKIISSVFSKRNASGSDEAYVSHVKIWEEAGTEGGGRKPRYILLSQTSNGGGFMHKSKLNTNGSFSVGKTWRIGELRGIQVLNPLSFNITLSRTYRWETESREEQVRFLEALVKVFRIVTGGKAPIQLEGVRDFQLQEEPRQQRPEASPVSNIASSSRAPYNSRPQNNHYDEQDYNSSRRNPSPARSSSYRNGLPPGAAPAVSGRERTASNPSRDAVVASRNRPPSINVPPFNLNPTPSPSQARRPSNAASTHSQGVPTNSQTAQPRIMPISINPSRDSQHSRDARAISQISDVPSRHGNASPTPSAYSRKYPTRADTVQHENVPPRRDQNARISYFDPTNQGILDRLLTQNTDSQIDIDGEEETAKATLTNVEEMIEGYEWASENVIGRKSTRGAVDLIEARLLDELNALEKANIHSFLESDDRVGIVMKYLDEAISELDSMDSLISSYKIHLNAVSEDILYIQSQNRGLQVQTQNQRALLGEIQNLLRTVHVDQEALITLTQESLEKSESIQRLEEASAELYKALQAGRDTDMAATMERLQEYRTHNAQFCKRMLDFLSIMFTAQSKLLIGDSNGLAKSARGDLLLVQHRAIETYLGRYAGLMLYLKEMDEMIYAKLCAAYFSTISDLHQTQMAALFMAYLQLVKKGPDEDQDSGGFGGNAPPTSRSAVGIRRAGTLIRSPLEGRGKDKDKRIDGDLRASEVFDLLLEQIQIAMVREDEFITDFLQINDAGLTFADYMGLDSYFRRQAARSVGLRPTTVKLIRGAMELIFGFLPAELKGWLDSAIAKDNIEIVGVLVTIERALENAEQRNSPFFLSLLDKQHARLKTAFDRHINEQLKGIEQTKLTSKKRRGVAPFIKHFSSYINRVENQLLGAEGLEVRALVDSGYEKIVQSMFESLKQMAKLEGEGEDKDQLNYHVILLENMHYFVNEMSKMELGSTSIFSQRAQVLYEENLTAYIKIVFRRPFAKLIDFFDAVERLGQNASALSSNSNYSKGALRKAVKEFNAKDIRKHIDNLYKRAEKHFTEVSEKSASDEMVLGGVWKACEQELVNLTDRVTSLISQHYSDSGVTLEFTKSDIESAFRKQRTNV